MKKLTFLMMTVVALFIFACAGADNDMEKLKNTIRDYCYRLDDMDAGKIIASNAKDIDKARLDIDTLQKQIASANPAEIDSLKKLLNKAQEKEQKTLEVLKENLEKLGIDEFMTSLKEFSAGDDDNLDVKYLSTEKNKEADRDLSKLNDRIKQFNDVVKLIKDTLTVEKHEIQLPDSIEVVNIVPKYEGIEFNYNELTIKVLPNEPTTRSEGQDK